MWQDWTQEDETNKKLPSLNKSPSETHFKNEKEFELWPLTIPPLLINHSKSYHQAFDLKRIWASNWEFGCIPLALKTRGLQLREALCPRFSGRFMAPLGAGAQGSGFLSQSFFFSVTLKSSQLQRQASGEK